VCTRKTRFKFAGLAGCGGPVEVEYIFIWSFGPDDVVDGDPIVGPDSAPKS
jgi:hypothetical protein